MKPHAAHRGRAPEVDEGDAGDLVALLYRELRPTPGRLGDCLRIVVVLLALVAIAEPFRISEIALSGYIVLFLSGREAVTRHRRSVRHLSRRDDRRAAGRRTCADAAPAGVLG